MRVPTYDAPTVGANTLPQPGFRPATFDTSQPTSTLRPIEAREARGINTPDIAGKELQNLGGNMQRLGQQMANLQIEAEREVMRVRVDDALNKAKEATQRLTYDQEVGFLNLKGNSALERPKGLSLGEEYGETLRSQFSEISDSLGTPAQKQMFAERSAELAASFRSGIMRHVSGEYQNFRLSVAQSSQKLYIDQIAKQYDNPAAVADAIEGIKAQVYNEAKLSGMSATWQEAKVLELTSAAHKVAVATALQVGDLSFAQGYLKQHSNEMDPVDQLPLEKAIKVESDIRLGAARADLYLGDVRAEVDPNDFERVVNITIQTESGGNPNAVSPKGAKGLMQVMDATNLDPGYGVTPARDDSPQERVRVGRDYMAAMIKQYGRLDMAWAAYNGGPGAVDKSVKKAAAAADRFRGVGDGDYLAYMPKETRDYVAKNMAAYEKGGGTPKARTMAEIDEALRADPTLASNPTAYKVARERAELTLRDVANAKRQRDEEAYNTALEMVEQNGGGYAALPLEVRHAIPPDKRDSVMNFAEKVVKGQAVETDPNVYYGLTIMAADNPQAFTGQDLRGYFDRLGPADRKHFMDLQAKVGKPDAVADVATAVQQTDAMAKALGFKDRLAGVFHQQADAALLAAQQEKGKKLNQQERQTVLDQLVIKGDIAGRWSDGYAFEARAEGRDFKPEFTDVDRRKATAALARAGNTKPTQAEIDATIRRAYGLVR